METCRFSSRSNVGFSLGFVAATDSLILGKVIYCGERYCVLTVKGCCSLRVSLDTLDKSRLFSNDYGSHT